MCLVLVAIADELSVATNLPPVPLMKLYGGVSSQANCSVTVLIRNSGPVTGYSISPRIYWLTGRLTRGEEMPPLPPHSQCTSLCMCAWPLRFWRRLGPHERHEGRDVAQTLTWLTYLHCGNVEWRVRSVLVELSVRQIVWDLSFRWDIWVLFRILSFIQQSFWCTLSKLVDGRVVIVIVMLLSLWLNIKASDIRWKRNVNLPDQKKGAKVLINSSMVGLTWWARSVINRSCPRL